MKKPPLPPGAPGAKDEPEKTVELNGRELVVEQDYPILPGTRCAFFTWTGCTIQITGPSVQEFPATNRWMRDYTNVAAVVERRRVGCYVVP